MAEKASTEEAEDEVLEICSVLLQLTSIEITDQRDQFCVEAAKSAASEGQLELVTHLVQAVSDPSTKNLCCLEAGKAAASKGHFQILEVLEDLMTDPDMKLDLLFGFLTEALPQLPPAGITQLLCIFISQNHVDLAFTLMHSELFSKQHVDQPESNGTTALMLAADRGHRELVEKLLDLGASVCAEDSQGRTALSLACEAGHVEAAKALVDRGADPRHRDGRGLTCVELADRLGFEELHQLLGCSILALGQPPFLERWDSVKLLSRGGFGEVHEVLTDRGIRCAAKTIRLPVQLGNQLDSLQREVDKALEGEKNLCRLQHDNIVRFLHMAQPDPAKVVVFMELLRGRSLETFIDNKPLEEDVIRKFTRQICSALVYIHFQIEPVIHRDINCSNIIVLENCMKIKLIDFSLSIKLEQSVSHISASSARPKGTLNFMAPELLGAGESESVQYSRESDIWALGCTVFQMASGSRPFAGHRNQFTLPERLRNSGAPSLPETCSAGLKDFYNCCTDRDRRKRQSAAELIDHQCLSDNYEALLTLKQLQSVLEEQLRQLSEVSSAQRATKKFCALM